MGRPPTMARPLRLAVAMNLFDLFIIYLACGAPFGVHRFLSRGDNSVSAYLESLLYALLWILLIPRLLHNGVKSLLRIRADRTRSGPVTFDASGLVRMIDESARTSGAYPGLYTLRDAVDRYSGISSLLSEQDSWRESATDGIFSVSGHPVPDLGSICLRRRNRRDLERHHREAAEDLIRLCRKMVEGSVEPDAITNSFRVLFTGFGDAQAVAALPDAKGSIPAQRGFERVKDKGQAVWETTRLLAHKNAEPALSIRGMNLISRLRNEGWKR
jgi:hypothetical protein